MTEAEKKLLQAQHRVEEVQARNRVKERKARTRRLIQKGAILEKVLCLQQFLLCICHKNPSSLSFLPDDLIAQSVGKLDGLRVSQGLPLELV